MSCVLGHVSAARATEPYLIKEINPGMFDGSDPVLLTEFGSSVFFSADDGQHGRELWRTDGSEATTVLFKDIKPGSFGSFPSWLTVCAGKLFFIADDGINDFELWVTDGSQAGTAMVAAVHEIASPSSPKHLTCLADLGIVVFSAFDIGRGWELWRSDGTAAGTEVVKDIQPGPGSSGPEGHGTNVPGLGVSTFEVRGNEIFFSADDGNVGKELWMSDGTEPGTVLVKDIYPGPSGSDIKNITNLNGTLYLRALGDDAHGKEPWISDGTEPGTVLLKDIYPGPDSSVAGFFTGVGGVVVFSACDSTTGCELWRTDGTETGTVLLKDIWSGPDDSFPSSFYEFNGLLYFNADLGVLGLELLVTDGTELGTSLVKDIYPGANHSNPRAFALFDGRLYFTAEGANIGCEIWSTDGTEAGTDLVADISTLGTCGNNLYPVGGALYFDYADPAYNHELWSLRAPCPDQPLPDCIKPHPLKTAGSLLILQNAFTNRLEWRMVNGGGTTLADIGTPAADTHYGVCVYDESGGVPELVVEATAPAGQTCPGNQPCWKQHPFGANYFNSEGTPDGIRSLQLRQGPPGASMILLMAKDPLLKLPPLPMQFQQDPKLTVQLVNSNGTCWEATPSAPAVANNPSLFLDQLD
jgi:ELWxxDGT repeat protein